MDRMTDADQRMLWPDEIWPQEIGALAVLDGGLAGRAAGGPGLAPRFSGCQKVEGKPCLSQTSDTRSPD